MDSKRLRCAAVLLALATTVIEGCRGGDQPDPNFDSHVARPAYSAHGPRVLFDEAHHNGHRAGKSYRPFVRLIESDGYRVSRGARKVTADGLRSFAVLIIANALGRNERNDDPAFDEPECDAIRDWVASGGALLLITDHYPTGHAAERLATRFGVQFSKGAVEDSTDYDRAFDPTHIVFSIEDGGLLNHSIVRGRESSEAVRRVLTFTGQAIFAKEPAARLLALSDAAVARPPQPTVVRRGSDVIVNVAYGDPEPVPGWAQGLALEYGKGRVVVLGEAAMLTAQLHRFDKRPIGMNVAGYDNRQLALNIMHWLSRVL
jgi:hypothetical protein